MSDQVALPPEEFQVTGEVLALFIAEPNLNSAGPPACGRLHDPRDLRWFQARRRPFIAVGKSQNSVPVSVDIGLGRLVTKLMRSCRPH